MAKAKKSETKPTETAKRQHKPVTVATCKRAVDLYSKLGSVKQVCERLKRNATTVYAILHEAGVIQAHPRAVKAEHAQDSHGDAVRMAVNNFIAAVRLFAPRTTVAEVNFDPVALTITTTVVEQKKVI